MTSFGAEKIKVIKEVRAITGLGLAEAKAWSRACPRRSRSSVKGRGQRDQGEAGAAGAAVELK
jgi:large subunit ribosomal protein L7/L12